jgi:glucose uptake protein GlcU
MNPFLGVFFHWLGGLASGSFYVPYRAVRRWSWETYWLVGGFFSWLIAPWFFALLNTTDVLGVLRSTPGDIWFYTYLFGALWGLGGLTFGLTMRYLGMSLGMAVALGYCTVFGTLIPPLFNGEFYDKLIEPLNGRIVLAGLGVCVLGIIITALAGKTKESEMSAEQKREHIRDFDFKKGIMVATFSGIMSACFAFGISAGAKVEQLTLRKDLLNSALVDGHTVAEPVAPSGDEVNAFEAALSESGLLVKKQDEENKEDKKAKNIKDALTVLDAPGATSIKIAALRKDDKLAAADRDAGIAKLEKTLAAQVTLAEAAKTWLAGQSDAVSRRLIAHTKAMAAAPEEVQLITNGMETLELKETALAIHASGANLPAIHSKHALWAGLPRLIIILLGGFTTNFIWCVLLNFRNKTGYQYFTKEIREQTPPVHLVASGGEGAPVNAGGQVDGRLDKTPVPMLGNYFFSALAGLTWYFQFFFYSMGETQMGEYKFSSWTLHMASIIIFSSIWGLLLKEWKGSSSKAKGLLFLGLFVLVLSTVVVGYGNYIGGGGGGH